MFLAPKIGFTLSDHLTKSIKYTANTHKISFAFLSKAISGQYTTSIAYILQLLPSAKQKCMNNAGIAKRLYKQHDAICARRLGDPTVRRERRRCSRDQIRA